MDEFKDILPWAECASPLFGQIGNRRYNSYDDYTTKSDSSFRKNTISDKVNSYTRENESIETFNLESYEDTNKGGVPFSDIEYEEFKLSDPFLDKNPFSRNYKPKRYNNKSKGAFSIPDVGSHVWVFFHGGNPMTPVYFASVMGKEDWDGVYDDLDYPTDYENWSFRDKQEYESENNIYRNKFLFNQKGGSIEISNTDYREKLILSHFSGSFKEFNNYATIELVSKNDQKMVLKDGYYSWKGNKNSHISQDNNEIVIGDSIKTIGKPNRDVVSEWKKIVDEIANLRQLFDIRRADKIEIENKIKYTSEDQTKSGESAPCPVCSGTGKKSYWVVDYSYNSHGIPSVFSSTDEVETYQHIDPKNEDGSVGQMESGDSGKIFEFDCPTCGGTGKSPSSKDGNWDEEELKKNIKQTINDNLIELAKLEEKMGIGGNEIKNIAKHKIQTVGYVFNDFSSIRLDPVGKIGVHRVTINEGGVFEEEQESPLLEYVYNSDFPSGDYNLTVGNKFHINVGSGGYKLKTYGPVDISGTISNYVGEQVNIVSPNEIILDGGKRIEIIADSLKIKQRNNKQVVIDSSLGVSRNMIIGGGLHVEGETTLNHVTAPLEIQQTLETVVYSMLLAGLSFDVDIDVTSAPWVGEHGTGTVKGKLTLTSNSNDDKVKSYPHSHHFPNLPLHLKKTINEVRERGMSSNEVDRNIAELVNNKLKIT
jgi:hypothetical protein